MCHCRLTLVPSLFLIISMKCATMHVRIRKQSSNIIAVICEWLLMSTQLSKRALIGPITMHILLYPRSDPSLPYTQLGYAPRSNGLTRKCGADRKTQIDFDSFLSLSSVTTLHPATVDGLFSVSSFALWRVLFPLACEYRFIICCSSSRVFIAFPVFPLLRRLAWEPWTITLRRTHYQHQFSLRISHRHSHLVYTRPLHRLRRSSHPP